MLTSAGIGGMVGGGDGGSRWHRRDSYNLSTLES